MIILYIIYNMENKDKMNPILQFLMVVVAISLFTIIVSSIFTFLDIDLDLYINYLAWIIGLGILYMVLPKEINL